MDSRLLAESAIGPATSGRTRWRGPGMTRSKISGAHFLREPRRIAVPGDAAVIEHIDAVGGGQREDHRREAQCRLVEYEQLWLHHQRTSQRQHLLFAAR